MATLEQPQPINRRSLLKSAGGLILAPHMGNCAIFDPSADAVSVHLHGVFDNGVTDAAAAINKLIDEIVANGGGTIYFPPSLYVAWRRKEQKYLRYQSAFWGHITDNI